MKNNIVNKMLSVFLALSWVFGMVPPMGFAQTAPSSLSDVMSDVKGFNKSVFESHFSRADRELNPDRWLNEARWGITQAICAWESMAFGLYDNPLLIEEAKTQIEKWSNEELEARFSKWLSGRFFGTAAEKVLTEIYAMFGETQKNYSWHLDDEGNIIFDDNTGDPLVIRPGDDNRVFSEDLEKWRNEAKNHVKVNAYSFDTVMVSLYPELLAYIPAELRETMGNIVYETGASMSGLLRREFENIAAREERIFTGRRTRDIWSLRRKSDDEAARIFTEQLIGETEAACARGIEELTVRIEQASAGTGDLAFLGEEWLRLYKEQFDRGLKVWEDAEERFFMRRIEWEQESFRLFSEGEEVWLASFNKFEEERRRWELKAKELFQSGEQLFKNISEDFEKSIAEAKQEFEYNMAMRTGAGTAKVQALVDMYLLCGSAAISAGENIRYWQNQCENLNRKDPGDSDFTDWLLEERKNLWKRAMAVYDDNPSDDVDLAEIMFQIQNIIDGKMNTAREITLARSIVQYDIPFNTKGFEALVEIEKSHKMYLSYIEKALDIRDRIKTDYAELIGSGTLKDILDPNVSSEDFCLDEYQIALVRAKTLVLYWERKTVIAEAVTKYAHELDAGRMTEAEGILAWENAKKIYNESLVRYETELQRLNAIGADIQSQQKILDELNRQMKEAEEKLNKLNADYSALVAASIIDRKDSTFLDFNTKYDLLVEQYMNLQKTGSDAVYRTVLEYGTKWGISEQNETAKKILDLLINGDNAKIPSLIALENGVLDGINSETDLKIRLAAIDLFSDTANGQIRSPDSTYSSADWYSKTKGSVLTEQERTALYGENLSLRLYSDMKKSYQILLEKKLELELEALKYFLSDGPVSEIPDPENAAYDLSQFCLLDQAAAAEVYEILLHLKERMKLGKGIYTENDQENAIISFFVSDGSFFTGSEKYLSEYVDEYLFCLGLLDIFNSYAADSYFIQNEIWRNTCNSLAALFNEYNLEMNGTSLPGVINIGDSVLRKPGDFVQNTAQFLFGFEKCFTLVPQWLEIELSNWKTALVEYISANALYEKKQPVNNSSELVFEMEKLQAKYNELYENIGSGKFIDDSEMESINGVFEKLHHDQKLLYFNYQIVNSWEKFDSEVGRAGNEKHWREFLTKNNLINDNRIIARAFSLKQGIMLDALDDAVYRTNRLNEAFYLFSQKENEVVSGNAALFFDLYSDEAARVERRFYSVKAQYGELERLGRAHEIAKLSPETARAKLENQMATVNQHEEIFEELKNKYLAEIETFISIGNLYDEQYSTLKKAYNDTDSKRFEYEVQDAVHRWASTAYLNTDNIDLEICKNRLANTQIVLTVLSDIYSGESRRYYDNPVYDALYSEYEQCFSRKLKVIEILETLKTTISQEQINNENIYSQYRETLNGLGRVDQRYSNYVSPARSSWSVKDIITVKDGQLAFSRDGTWTLTGVDASRAEIIDNYFKATATPNGEWIGISQFEQSVRALSQNMAGYFTDPNKFRQWSFARDYLLTSLKKANGDLGFLNNYYSGIGQMENGGALGSLTVKTGFWDKPTSMYSAIGGSFNNAEALYRAAWDGLSAREKADLEFYVILTLTGNYNDYFAGFSQMYTLDVYKTADNYIWEKYREASKEANALYNYVILTHWTWAEMRDINYSTGSRILSVRNETERNVQKWTTGLMENLQAIQSYALAYSESCNILGMLHGTGNSGQSIGWGEINRTLLETGKFKSEDIDEIKTYWEMMQAKLSGNFQTVPAALGGLLRWIRDTEDQSRQALENHWLIDEQNRQKDEYDYYRAQEAFIDGTIDTQTLEAAAEKAFGKNAPAWKNHFENMQMALLNDLSQYLNYEKDFFAEFGIVGDELVLLTMRTLDSRFKAELAARETEWNQIRQDIKEKYLEWTESAAELLENGRADWNAGIKKMEEAYGRWITGFREEHNRVSEEWAEVYLAGLEDKEKWLEQVTAAANQASNESFLSLIGAEAERFSRVMDTREPFGIRNAAPEAETLMAELLQTSGISSMAGAFDSLNKNSGFISSVARRGMGGVSIWDASLARSAASDLARKNNAELADRESRKLARSAREAADEAVKNIAVNVDSANRDFRQNMDNTFIFQGLWRRNGNNYVKDIIMGSTLFQPVISETETVKGYTDYRMEPVTLKTNLDENYLAGLDSVVIMAMLENVFLEVETIVKEIFGTGEESKKIDQDRDQSPGKFGVYIGYVPAVKPPGGTGSSKSSMFYDQGSGELGRLMTEYFYWNLIDQMGSAEFSLAAWDKRMWDDRNSFFDAPTLRTTVKVTGAIAAAVVSAAATPLTGGASLAGVAGAALLVAGINSTGDLAFAGLDAAFGYKTIDEAAFEWGKASLINTATSLGSGFLGAAGSLVTGTMGAVTNAAFQTGMAGVQTATTTLITSAVNGITYSNENGLGYSSEIFKSGFTGIGANLLSSMSSAATMGALQIINSGTIGEKLTGFSNLNRSDLAKLNGLASSLTGQGINYAMGGDFTMNILNIGLFTDGKINSGLLELHLGRDGTSMSIGTGGANVSIENLAAAYRGTLVWNVNNRIDKYTNNNEFDGKIALRAQYGFGDNTQTGQLWNILKGKDEIWLTGKEGDFAAETTIVDGKRIINLAGYESDMSVEEQMRLAVILGHEAYRDGIVTGDNYLETRQAVLAHTEMAMRMLIGGQSLAFDKNLEKDLIAYNVFGNAMGSLSLFNGYIDNNYDSSGDYWKLTKEGNLEYDGFATLRDAEGNILRSYREMGLKNDNSVEGALLWLLSINQKDSTGVAAVRKMMERSGLKHSFDADPNNWMWKGEHMAITGNRGSFPTMGTLDLTRANMGKTININAIAKLFTTIGTSGTNINNSVNRIYGSSIGFLNYADTGGNTGIANSILLNYYTVPQLTMVQANQNWLNESLKNTVNINGMIRGNPERTGGFGETYDDIKLSSSSVAGASYFSEIHTGIDFGSGGTGIYAPGGNWQLINVDDHKAYYRLYGGDMTMRIQHLNPKTLSGLLPGTIYSGTADKLVDYPTASYGSGSGAHIHIDMTRWLPYNGSYTRQFVNPETLLAGNRLEYQYSYMDAAKVDLPGYPMNFYRY